MSFDNLLRKDEETLKICRHWKKFSTKLFITYQKQSHKELKFKGKPLKFSKLLQKFKKKEVDRKANESKEELPV